MNIEAHHVGCRHPDYIRAIVVHPVLPVVLTASDDMTIRMFDWEKDWKCVREFGGHQHYVMGLSVVSGTQRDITTRLEADLFRIPKTRTSSRRHVWTGRSRFGASTMRQP